MADEHVITRKEFVRRSLKAGTAALAAGGAAYLFYDEKGPDGQNGPAVKGLPDFSVKAQKEKSLAIVRGGNRESGLFRAVDLLGGMGRFIQKGDRVIIKPNIAFASSPNLGATSHPDIVQGLVSLCLKAGAGKVAVMDNPINDPAACYLLSGIEKAVKDAGGEMLRPEGKLFAPLSLEGGKLIRNWPVLYRPLMEADRLIGTAPLKSHNRSGASMTMKNWYGLLGGRRNIFHQDIHTIITELALLVKPTLVVLDAHEVMMENGPTGGSLSDLVKRDTIIAGTNQVAVDAFGASILGLSEKELPHLLMAQRAGAGSADYRSLSPIEAKAERT